MTLITEIAPIFAVATLTTIFAASTVRMISPLLSEQRKRRERNRSKIKDLISIKLNNSIDLSTQDVLDIARGAGGSSHSGIEALYELYSATDDKELHTLLKNLLAEYNKEEPFESLPEESRPSLARISTLCEESSVTTDRELLHPIRKLLEEYQTMKQDHQSIKKQSWISYIVAIVSFFIGMVGLILAFQGPSKQFISDEIRSALSESSKIDSAEQDAAPNH
jgi:hypothetical protein